MKVIKTIQFDEKEEKDKLAEIISLAERSGVDEAHVKALNVLYCGTMVTHDQLAKASLAIYEVSNSVRKNAAITFGMLSNISTEYDTKELHRQIDRFKAAYTDGVDGHVKRMCDVAMLLIEASARMLK